MDVKVKEGRKFNFTIIDNDIIDNINMYSKSMKNNISHFKLCEWE